MSTKKTSKTLNVPNLRFPGFEGEWEKKYGNEIFLSVSDKIHNSDLPILAITQEHGAIPRELIDYKITVTSKSIEGYKVVKEGDFIISLRSFQGGIEYSNYSGICSPAYVILRPMIPIDQIFYKFYLKTDSYIVLLNKKLEGIRDGKMISYKYFSEIILPFPSLKEQTKVASFLTLINNRIQTQNKIIDYLKSLIKGTLQNLEHSGKGKDWKKQYLNDLLIQRNELNVEGHAVHSVSVSKGVVNQVEYLGRSFAAKDISNYNVVHFGDIVYTKSPTGSFPFGIIKQSFVEEKVAVSPLYGVFVPKSKSLGRIIHYYFENPVNSNNYLRSLVQKGAKNTINITNSGFLENAIYLPADQEQLESIANLLTCVSDKINLESRLLLQYEEQKKYLLQNLFI